MALTTAEDIVNLALRASGVLGVGQTALAQDQTDAFDVLNAMLGVWNRQRWLVWHLVDASVVSTGAQSYTVGIGGDINVARPDRLEAAFFRQIVSNQPNLVDYPLEILESREDYNSIALKTLVSWPEYIFYDSAWPMGSIYPWPVPQASLFEIHISLKEVLTQFATLTDTINMPPEYIEPLWSNLAVRMAAIYPGIELNPITVALAKKSLAVVRGANAQIARLTMPNGLGRPALYNIYSDQTY